MQLRSNPPRRHRDGERRHGHAPAAGRDGSRQRHARRDDRAGPRTSLVGRAAARRQLPRHRTPRPPAPRRRRTARSATDRRRAGRVRARARAACSMSCSRPISRRPRSIYLSYRRTRRQRHRRHRRRHAQRSATTRCTDVRVIYRQQPKLTGGDHFGSRIVFDGHGPCVHQPGRTQRSPDRAEARHAAGQARAPEPRRQRAARQPLRRPQGCAPGNLELRPSQHAGPGARSAHRHAVGKRTRPARRRRDQPAATRQELRLADHHPRHRLFGPARFPNPSAIPRRAWSSRTTSGRSRRA